MFKIKDKQKSICSRFDFEISISLSNAKLIAAIIYKLTKLIIVIIGKNIFLIFWIYSL